MWKVRKINKQNRNGQQSKNETRYFNVIELTITPIEISDMVFQREINVILKNGIKRKIKFMSDYKQSLQFGGA